MKKGFLALAITLLLTLCATPALAAEEAEADLASTLWAWVVEVVAAFDDGETQPDEMGPLLNPGG